MLWLLSFAVFFSSSWRFFLGSQQLLGGARRAVFAIPRHRRADFQNGKRKQTLVLTSEGSTRFHKVRLGGETNLQKCTKTKHENGLLVSSAFFVFCVKEITAYSHL